MGCKPTGYADDLSISISGHSIVENMKKLSTTMKVLDAQWCIPYNQPLAKEKCSIIHFEPPRHRNHQPSWMMRDLLIPSNNGITPHTLISEVASARLLGVVLDNSLSFKEHIIARVTKTTQTLGALRRLGHQDWGLNKQLRIRAVKCIITPIINYAAVSWAPYTTGDKLHDLEKLYRQALVWAGGFKYSTPTETVLAETNMLPLDLHLRFRCSYTVRKWSALSHVTEIQHRVQTQNFTDRRIVHGDPISNSKERTLSLADRILQKKWFFDYNVNPPAMEHFVPPWDAVMPPNLTLISNANKEIAKKRWLTRETSKDEKTIFTDGSKQDEGCGFAIYSPPNTADDEEVKFKFQLPDSCNIFQAEASALRVAVNTAHTKGWKNVVIATDSLSSVQALRSTNRKVEWETHLLRQSIRKFCDTNTNKLTIQWIPSHEDIEGNDIADHLAKEACTKGIFWKDHPSAFSTIKRQLLEKAEQEWSTRFNSNISKSYVRRELPTKTHLHNIYDGLSTALSSLIAEFRSGHTRLLPIQNRNNPPPCTCRTSNETVEHFLLHCPQYDDLRMEVEVEATEDPSVTEITRSIILDNPAIIHSTALYLARAIKRRTTIIQQRQPP